MESESFSDSNLCTSQGEGAQASVGGHRTRKACIFVFFRLCTLTKASNTSKKKQKQTHTNANTTTKMGASVADEEGHLVHLPDVEIANLSLRKLPQDHAEAETKDSHSSYENREAETRKNRSPYENRDTETKRGSQDENERKNSRPMQVGSKRKKEILRKRNVAKFPISL